MARRERGPRRGKPLGRATGRRAPKDLIVVWMEGENTEAGWVEHLIQRSADVAIDLQILSHPGEGVPHTLVAKAKRSRGDGVEVWVVFDRDEHDLTTALKDARDAGLGVVFFNPGFELWPLLHLRGHTRPEHRHDLQGALHQAHRNYRHDRGAVVNWEQRARHVAAATRRALACTSARRIRRRAPRRSTTSPDRPACSRTLSRPHHGRDFSNPIGQIFRIPDSDLSIFL
jgi:hypothetical protein